MIEENDNLNDNQGAQDYLNNLLENQTVETPNKEESVDDERLSAREAELLKNAANIVDADEELDPKQVQKLLDFVGGDWKNKKTEELKDDELEKLTQIAIVKSGHFNYRPKKNFGVKYKKERKRKNNVSKLSRRSNR